MTTLAEDLADLDLRAHDLVGRCCAVLRRSRDPFAAEVLLFARVLAAKVSVLVGKEKPPCR